MHADCCSPLCLVCCFRWRFGSKTVALSPSDFTRRRWRSWSWQRGPPCYTASVRHTCRQARHGCTPGRQRASHIHSSWARSQQRQWPRSNISSIISISRTYLRCRDTRHWLDCSRRRLLNWSASFRSDISVIFLSRSLYHASAACVHCSCVLYSNSCICTISWQHLLAIKPTDKFP